MNASPLRKYLRKNSLPHFFCPGCGAAQVLNFFVQAAGEIDLDFDKLVAIGGVGCAARIPVYLNAEALHGVHGRTLPWATGIKLHRPDLDVVIFSGDGDAGAIGGNHLIQAARRNLDVTMVVVNNLTFAMTGGQVAPTTFQDIKTATTPYGNVEKPFDLCKLAETAGATFISRWTTNQPRRAIGSGDPVDGLEWIKGHSVTFQKAASLTEKELAGRFVLGNFVEKAAPVFSGSSLYNRGGGK